MIIVKYTFLFLIFLGASLVGNLISKKYKNRVNELKTFKEACNILKSKIKFTYEPLGEIFKDISNLLKQENSINQIFEDSSIKMEKGNFKDSWDDAVNSAKANLSLKKEDLNVIKALGNMLGKTDAQGQISEIDLTMNFLDTQIAIAEDECKKNEKMYRTLGTIFGLAIVIILI